MKYNFDRTSAFNIITLVEFIRNMPPAKNMTDVLPKLTSLDRAHQEYYRIAGASNDKDFIKMKANGISIYPEVFKKTDMIKILPEVIVKELKKSTNVDFERDTYDNIRDIVTTIVHNHLNSAAPMDVDKKPIMNLDSADGDNGEEDGDEANQEDRVAKNDEDTACVYDERGVFIGYVGKGGKQGPGKGKGKGKDGKFTGECYTCGQTGHKSFECWQKGKGKGEQNKGYGRGGGWYDGTHGQETVGTNAKEDTKGKVKA